MSELTDLIETETVLVVEETLLFLLHECSLEEAPSVAEVNQWRDILQQRGGKFQRLATECQRWLDEVNA